MTRTANSHSGQHGDFSVFWINQPSNPKFRSGWYWLAADGDKLRSELYNEVVGPFETSQAAFGDYKDHIDAELSHPYYTEPAKYGL